jgi:hypothetical protein
VRDALDRYGADAALLRAEIARHDPASPLLSEVTS